MSLARQITEAMQNCSPLLIQWRGWNCVPIERPRSGVLAVQLLSTVHGGETAGAAGLCDISQRQVKGLGRWKFGMHSWPSMTTIQGQHPPPFRVPVPMKARGRVPHPSKGDERCIQWADMRGIRQPTHEGRQTYEGIVCSNYRLIGCSWEAYREYFPQAVDAYLIIARAIRVLQRTGKQ